MTTAERARKRSVPEAAAGRRSRDEATGWPDAKWPLPRTNQTKTAWQSVMRARTPPFGP
ncbi:hypothetical protein [Natrinema altunense]|uniref:hypothetical protein n=1 Tax=Natrinema altunense TaxID=222984 RepID=UPI00135F1608|nr:hypothetical protein [Natrinema altunense]